MSKCTHKEAGDGPKKTRRHDYDGNRCTRCGHVTSHGKRFRSIKAEAK